MENVQVAPCLDWVLGLLAEGQILRVGFGTTGSRMQQKRHQGQLIVDHRDRHLS